MPSFAGFPQYLHAASLSLGLPASVKEDARRQPALGQVASLVSQALATPPGFGRSDSIRRARELADALRIASIAADSMLAEVDPPAAEPTPNPNPRKDK